MSEDNSTSEPLTCDEVYEETADGTFLTLLPYLDPTLDIAIKERIKSILKHDYKLIHLLTKRYNMR